MFAQKTDYLARIIERESCRQVVLYYKITLGAGNPEPANIMTHAARGIRKGDVQSFRCPNEYPLIEHIRMHREEKFVVIDEVQFLSPSSAETIRSLVERSVKTVIAAGLDMDYMGVAFDTVAKLCCYADEVVKLKAVCSLCGQDATYSHRTGEGNERLQEGSGECYSPMCRQCFREAEFHRALKEPLEMRES
jgi:thymidine kinase